MPPAAPRPNLGAHRYQGPFQTGHDYIQLRRNAGKNELLSLESHKPLLYFIYIFKTAPTSPNFHQICTTNLFYFRKCS